MSYYQPTSSAAGAAARMLVPRLAPFLAPIPGANGLLFALTAIAAAYALYELIRQLRGMSGWRYTACPQTGTGAGWGPSGNPSSQFCNGTLAVNVSAWTEPTAATSAVWAGRKFAPNPTFGYVHEAWGRNAGAPSWSAASQPYPTRAFATPQAERDRLIALGLTEFFPSAQPWDRPWDYAPIWPVWAISRRDAVQARLAPLSSTMTQRGYDAPVTLPVVLSPPLVRPLPRVVPGVVDLPVVRPLPRPLPWGVVLNPAFPTVRPITMPVSAAPPLPFTDEIKTRAYPLVRALHRAAINAPSEMNDAVQALYDALPKPCQKSKSAKRARQDRAIRKAGGYNTKYKRAKNSTVGMLRDVARCSSEMDIGQAAINLLDESLVDRVFGQSGAAIGGLNRNANLPLGVEMMTGKAPKADNIRSKGRPKPRTPLSFTAGDVTAYFSRNFSQNQRARFLASK